MRQKQQKKQQLRVKLITLISLSLLIITGCSNDNEIPNTTIYDDITRVSREVNIENKEELISSLLNSINDSDDALIDINDNDTLQNANINNYYFFNDAVYLQIETYMYRFQLQDGNVVSYIKYNLEA